MDKAFLSRPQTITIDRKEGGQLTLRAIPEFDDATEAVIYGGLAFQLLREDYGMFQVFCRSAWLRSAQNGIVR